MIRAHIFSGEIKQDMIAGLYWTGFWGNERGGGIHPGAIYSLSAALVRCGDQGNHLLDFIDYAMFDEDLKQSLDASVSKIH